MAQASSGSQPPVVILENSLIRIRHFQTSDASVLAQHANNQRVSENLRNYFPFPYTPNDAQEFLARPQVTGPNPEVFAICTTKPQDTIMGAIELKPLLDVEHRTAELGYWIAEPFWGRGIASLAARELCTLAFQTVENLLRIEATVLDRNVSSQKVLRKVGFKLEGRRRRAAEKNGVVLDILIFGLLREECLGTP